MKTTNVHADDVQIGNGDGFVDMFQITRMNSFGLVLNAAPAVNEPLTGCGLVFNDAGHGNGDAIDFYTEGTLRGWIDQNGWTNA